MAENPWVWDTTSRRYRNASTGRWISHTKVAELRNEFAALQREWADVASSALTRGDWTVRRWELEIRDRLKRVFVAEYMLGRGGKNVMSQADYGRIGSMLREQYQFLRGFALDIQAGKLTEAQIAARTQMYHDAGVQAFERGKAAAYGGELILPGFPADGRTRCRSRCRCRWSIRETKKAWKAYWRRNPKTESCRDCVFREQEWSPYVQYKIPE